MKRLLTASIVAVSLHVLLFQISPGWLERKTLQNQQNRTLALSLSYVEPEKPQIKPILQSPPVVPQKKTDVVKKKEKKIKAPQKKPKEHKKTEEPLEKIKEKEDIPSASAREVPTPAEEETNDFVVSDSEEDLKEREISNQAVEPTAEKIGTAKEALGLSKNVTAAIDKDAMPLYKVNPRPDYPRVARRRGYEGTVVLLVFVTRQGKVGDIGIDKSSGYPVLDRSALTSVKEWLFEPATKRGNKVDMWVKVPVTFRLR